MFTFKFKQGFPLEFDKRMKSYLDKNYGTKNIFLFLDSDSYKKIEPFIIELNQNRNVLVKILESDRSFENLKMFREISINYLLQINQLKNKINFGKDSYSLKIDFTWKDTLTEEKNVSNSIHFEYYSVFFNLALINFEMGKYLYFSDDELKLKEAVKLFQTAAWSADRIKEEFQLYVQANNIQPDLSMNYMSYVKIKFYILFLLYPSHMHKL